MVLSHLNQDNGGAGARGDPEGGTLASARLQPRATTPSVLPYTTSINRRDSLLSERKTTLVSPEGAVVPASRTRRSGLGELFSTGRVRDGGGDDGKVGKQGGVDNNTTTNNNNSSSSTSSSTSTSSGDMEAAEQYDHDEDRCSCGMPFSCASSKGAVAHLSESHTSSFTSPQKKGKNGRESCDGATSLRYPSTMQRTRSSENTTFDLVGTIFTVPQSPVSSMSSLNFSEESGGEGNFKSWLRQTRKTRNTTIFAQGGKGGNAIVSKDLIALARARQEREAREESDSSSSSSSTSSSKSESSNHDDDRRNQLSRGPTRTLTLSSSRRALAVAPRVSFRTVGPVEGFLPPKSSQNLTAKTQSRDVRRGHLQADLVPGNDQQDLNQGLEGGRGDLGVDVRKPEPERGNFNVSSTARKMSRMSSGAKCMSSVHETRDEEGEANEDVSTLPSQTRASSPGDSRSANRPAYPILDAVSATKGIGNGSATEATCVLADEDGVGAECTASSVASAANPYSTLTSINQGAVAFDMALTRDKNTSPSDGTSNVFPSKEEKASMSTSKETASRRLHHQAALLFDSKSDQPELQSPTGSGDQFVVESKGQSPENKTGTSGSTGGCFTPERAQLQSVVVSASKRSESVLGMVVGDSTGRELRKDEGTDHQPEVVSGRNDGKEEEGASQCHSKQKKEQERVAGEIATEGANGAEGPRIDKQPVLFLDSKPEHSDEVASSSEGRAPCSTESVLGDVVGDSNGRELRKEEGTDRQPEAILDGNNGSEEGAGQRHSKDKAEQERVAGGIATEGANGAEGPRGDEQTTMMSSDEVASPSAGRTPRSTESVLEEVVGDSNGRELRKEEGTDRQPEAMLDGNNGSEEGAGQRHSKDKAEQERVAGGIATEGGNGAEGPRGDEQTTILSSIRSVDDEQNQQEEPATDHTSCSQIDRASAKDGLSNQAGLLALPADVSRQQEASPITTGHDSQTPRVGGRATAPDLCLVPEFQRQTVPPPVPHDAPSSPVKPLDTNAGMDSRSTWGNEHDSMDAFLVDDIGLSGNRCGKSTRFLLPAQPETQPKTQAQPPPPKTTSNGALKDSWRARILAEATTVIVNRGDIWGSASVSPPELTGRGGDGTACCGDGLKKNIKETASADFGSAALMEIRASVAKDPWYTRILAEAAATLANGSGMQHPAALIPSNVTFSGDDCDVGCGHTRTAREPVPADSPTQPIVSDNAVVRSPFSSRSQAEVAGRNKLSCEGKWGSGGRERAQLVQQSTPTTTRGPRTVRDSWSMRILAEAAATLTICGVVRRSVLFSTVETVPIDLPSVRGNRRCGFAATALSSDGDDSGSTTGGRTPRMSLPILRGRRSKRCGDSGSTPRGRSPRMSLPILRGRGSEHCMAETLPLWGCCSGLERFPGHPMIVDYGLLGCDLSDSPRISSRRCTACTRDNNRKSPKSSNNNNNNNRISFPGNPQHGHLGKSTSEGEHVRAPTPPARRAHSSDSVSACTPRSRIAEKIGVSAVAQGGEDDVNLRLRGHVVFPAALWEGDGGRRGGDSNSISGDCRRRLYLPKTQHGPSDTSGEVAPHPGSDLSPPPVPVIIDSGSLRLDLSLSQPLGCWGREVGTSVNGESSAPSINPRSSLKERRIMCSRGTDPIPRQETRAPTRKADVR